MERPDVVIGLVVAAETTLAAHVGAPFSAIRAA
jgi:hypothetical protein